MASAQNAQTPHVHVIAGPVGTGRSRVAGELAGRTGAPIVVADRVQCYLDLAVTSARPPGGAATRYYLAARQVIDGDLPTDVAANALVTQIGALIGDHPLVLVEGGSVELVRGLLERRDASPFQLTSRVLNIHKPAEHVVHLRARALRMLSEGMLEEFALAWRHTAQRSFVASINGLDAVAQWCELAAVTPEELVFMPRNEDLLLELAGCVARSHLERATAQESAFLSLLGEEPARSFAASWPGGLS